MSTTQATIEAVDKVLSDRRKIADAEAQRVAQIIAEARKTDDPVKLLDLKKELREIAPDKSLDALLLLVATVADTPKEQRDDMKAARAAQVATQKAQNKRLELEQTTSRLRAELEQLEGEAAEAEGRMAEARIIADRFRALAGEPVAGQAVYQQPEIRAWAKLEKVI